MQVVDFVLDDFCRKSREGLRLLPEEGIHELDLDLVSAPRLDLNKALEKLRVTL